jgi:anti-sigma regulatory factor (Ser/Thr protein kinase)
VGTRIKLGRSCGADGFNGDLPLDRELEAPIVVDASGLRECHAMFALRLRMFIDWHRGAGHSVTVIAPQDAQTAQGLADLGVADGLDAGVLRLPEPSPTRHDAILPLVAFSDYTAVEDVAREGVELLQRQTDPFGSWGDAMYMAISELCNNALQHGRNDLGAYIAADRILEPRRQMRLAIADLGIGIPEHIRARHPEWHDDSAAIGRALEQGVSGTNDPYRGNGFAEVFDAAMRTDLVRASSAADIDLRAGKGRLGVTIAGGNPVVEQRDVGHPRRGTWITYTVTTA